MFRRLPFLVLAWATPFAVVACSSQVESNPDSGQPVLTIPRACALSSVCNPEDSFGGICQGLELAKLEHPSWASMYACVEEAKDCAGLDACFAGLKATPEQAAVCNTPGAIRACSGDTLVLCTETDHHDVPYISDCASGGYTCSQGDYVAGETSAVCSVGTCDPATESSSCDGDAIVFCEPWGAKWKATCDHGKTCGLDAEGDSTCTGAGEACDDITYTTHCEGTKIVSCSSGKVARDDCAKLTDRMTCSSDEHGVFCDGAGSECDSHTPETCADGVIGFCLWGKWTTLDCKAQGMTGCKAYAYTSDTYARCTL